MEPIKEIRFIYPSIMGKNAASEIKKLIESISEMKDKKAELFSEQLELERKIAEAHKVLDAFDKTYEIIYEKRKVEDKPIEHNYGPAIKESNGTFHSNF